MMDRLKSKFLGSLAAMTIGLFYYDDPEKLRKVAEQSSKITRTHVYRDYIEDLAEKLWQMKTSKETER